MLRRANNLIRCAAVFGVLLVALIADADDAIAAPGDHVWSARFGDADNQISVDVAVDGSGNALLVGYFSGTINLGGGTLVSAGGLDLFVAKFDGSGGHIWSKRFGSISSEVAKAVAIDSGDRLIITGGYGGDTNLGGGTLSGSGVFLLKINEDGDHVWSEGFATPQQLFTGSADLAIDGSDNAVLVGEFIDTVDFGGGALTSAGEWDVYVATFDSFGAQQWSARYGDPQGQAASGVAFGPAGSIVVTGSFIGTVNFGGSSLTSIHSQWSDTFLVKFDGSGIHEWSQQFGGPLTDFGSDVETTSTGDVWLTGAFKDTIDFGGGALLTAGEYDVYLARFDAGGTHEWSSSYGGTYYDLPAALELDDSGNVIVTGGFNNGIDFGGGTLTAVSSGDMFVASFDAGGTHNWSKGFGELDSDGDGFCTDGEEAATSHALGGQRNPNFAYDFYDVDGTGKVDAIDIGLVRGNFNPSGPVPPEDEIYDRSAGAAPWAPGAPDNKINAVDIGHVRASFNDSCVDFGHHESGNSIAIGAANAVFATGSFRDSLDFGGGPLVSAGNVDAMIVKFDGSP